MRLRNSFLNSDIKRISIFSNKLHFVMKIHRGIYYKEDTKTTLIAIILLSAGVNGFGAAVLWVSQGKYISQCAIAQNKGIFNGIFWAFYMSSNVLGNLMGAFVLGPWNIRFSQ